MTNPNSNATDDAQDMVKASAFLLANRVVSMKPNLRDDQYATLVFHAASFLVLQDISAKLDALAQLSDPSRMWPKHEE